MKNLKFIVLLCILSALGTGSTTRMKSDEKVEAKPAGEEVKLVVRGDDIGSSHAANVACIRSFREGIVRTVEVMVPSPWFPEAVKMINENPGLDVGVHLTLTSEWDSVKWGPLTHAPSLVDENGYFYPMTSQRGDFPPNTGFLQAEPKLDEVEKELRAQIELAKKRIPNVTHLTSHMGTASCTPPLKAIVKKLAREYELRIGAPGARSFGRFPRNATPAQKVDAMMKLLNDLKPGVWIFVEHPGLDVEEMRAIGHKGYRDVAKDREGVTRAFTSPRVKEVIERRGIKLLCYADLY